MSPEEFAAFLAVIASAKVTVHVAKIPVETVDGVKELVLELGPSEGPLVEEPDAATAGAWKRTPLDEGEGW